MNLKPRRSVRPWYAILLAAVAAGVIIFGVTQLGTPTTSSARTSSEEVAAEDGVVQTTVSGSGEVEPGIDDTLNFGTSGTLQSVDVKVGQRVKKGQLIATLDPSSAELTLEEAKASLTSAEDNLTEVEDGTSTGSASSGGSSSSSNSSSSSYTAATASTASVASVMKPTAVEVDYTGTTTTPTTTTDTAPTTTTGTVTAPTAAETTTAPATTTTPITTVKKTTKKPTKAKRPTSTKPATQKPTSTKSKSKASSGTNTAKTTANTTARNTTAKTTATTTTTKPTAAEIQQAEVQVDEAKATVSSDEKAVSETKLYAPASGLIASLAGDSVGQTVSSGSSSAAAASQSSATGSSSTGSTGSTGSSSSSSSGFAELINDNTMTMTVSLSEDDISSVKVGQMATVSITALSGVELAGRVSSISPLGSDSSGVVSYDATISVSQANPKVLPGMSATATIVTGQAQGVTVPSDAITGAGSDASVQLVNNGKVTTRAVVVGLKGSSRSQIVSGLKAGQEVKITITLPSLGTTTTSSSSGSSTSGFGGFGGAGAGGFGGTGGTGGFRSAARAFFGGGGAG